MELEATPLKQFWSLLVLFGGPFLAFGFGVRIAHVFKFYSNIAGKHLALMSFPVALLVLGTLLSSASVQDPLGENRPRLCGYTESVGKYMVSGDTVKFLGTSTPNLFEECRKRLEQQ